MLSRIRACALLLCLCTAAGLAATYRSAVIVIGAQASPIEKRVASLLAGRISEPSALAARVADELPSAEAGVLRILLGVPARHPEILRAMDSRGLPPLTALEPGPEGFLLQTLGDGVDTPVLAAGIDERGVLYAAGEILRRMEIGETSLEFPEALHIRTAPAFEIRGTQFGQSGVALTKGKVRKWSDAELRRAILDFALAGLNTVEIHEELGAEDVRFRVAREFGLKTLTHDNPNMGQGPPEWRASESIGREHFLCPSVPAAREALIRNAEERYRNLPPIDYIRFAGGDGGGCECDRCTPYGKTFIHLTEDIAAVIRKHQPLAQFFITNQKFDNASDLAIFEYLREKPRPWLRAFAYGPGSDAMSWQPGHRQDHRMDLFRYPGFGPPGRYLQEILHELPPQQDLVFFNEITHWRYSQNGYAQAPPRADRNGDRPPHWNHWLYERQPDRALTMVYDRLTFFAWPRYLHWYFNQTMRYGIGDVTHSSGTHDHFNQWMWQRMLWSPQSSLDGVVNEYARTWFGPAGAPLMAKAIFELEAYLVENPKEPISRKAGISRYYDLVHEAGRAMPPTRRKSNWLWLEYAQKAAVDRYTQLRFTQQINLQARIEKAIGADGSDASINRALSSITELPETPEMRQLREEAERFGEESNRLFGVRSEGIFNLQHDFIGLGWLKRQLERAKTASGEKRADLLRTIAAYEDPGEGGFYDDGGSLTNAPRIVNGYPYDFGQPFVPEMLSEANRPSQRTMHYTQDEDKGIVLRYKGLDPTATWRIRFSLVRPRFQDRYRDRMNQHTQTIYAGGLVLAKDVEVPEGMSDFFTYEIPASAIRNGELVIRFERAPDVARGDRISREVWRNTGGWGTILAEAWLMKKPAN
ncbi:MAG: hypothetical protein IT170_03940 [Bryobacterales bacterium]|nr:hypothetical protein [Bryobacterales bacterium]